VIRAAASPKCYGGFWRRLAATLLDNFLYSAISLPVTLWLFGPAYLQTGETPFAHGEGFGIGLLELVFAILPYVLIVLFWVRMGATPGKLLMECQVVDAETGALPSLKQALLRLLGYLISGPLTLGIGFLWIAWDKRKQGLHDKLAGTVVRLRQDDYFYRTLPSMDQIGHLT
jgi:uncharacterized RDD family membrane protein YckC